MWYHVIRGVLEKDIYGEIQKFRRRKLPSLGVRENSTDRVTFKYNPERWVGVC